MLEKEFFHSSGFSPDRNQKKAIVHKDGPLLVLAGPGSGKTTVLTQRILYLTSVHQIPEECILVLTFTKKAASEMETRYLDLKGSVSSRVTFGTFHSVFYRILRENSEFGRYRLILEDEIMTDAAAVLKETCGEAVSARAFAESVCSGISAMKNGVKIKDPLVLSVYPVLKKKHLEEKRLDFDDMLLYTFRLLIDSPQLLARLRKQYRYILVDEFQDINRTQYEVLRLLAEPAGNIFAVGDDDQSIYGFRGSDPSFMKRFLTDFGKTEKILLSVNYRSVSAVVRASLSLIRHNRKRFRKRLHASAPYGTKPVIRCFSSVREEADYIKQTTVRSFDRLIASGTGTPSAAVLGRTNSVLESVKKELDPEFCKKLSFLTFHSSKGLEFDLVFIAGANEEITPGKRNLNGNGLEEERRCFYVAVTRAKHFLHILYTSQLYNKSVKVTRFVNEIRTSPGAFSWMIK